MAKKRSGASSTRTADYRHAGSKRKNNPPAKIASEGRIPKVERARYAYSPHLPPNLRFDPTGGPDKLPELLAAATKRPLSASETAEIAVALRQHEPWLEWTEKREQHERGFFEVDPVALHIHERVSAQAILKVAARQDVERSLFADPEQEYHEAVQFYQHDIDWTNRLIFGDSLQVMSSLTRRENLAGKVQMIYIDPPYGIKFASNFQPEVGKRDVKENDSDLTRELEMVRAYRDTWHLGVHSYLSYLRDRLIVARELLSPLGSIFVQISDENLHRVRSLMDEVFGAPNCFSIITFQKTTSASGNRLPVVSDYLLWYARDPAAVKYRPLTRARAREGAVNYDYVWSPTGEARRLSKSEAEDWSRVEAGSQVYRRDNLTSQRPAQEGDVGNFVLHGRRYEPRGGTFKTNKAGLERLRLADRLEAYGVTLAYRRMADDYPCVPINNLWTDTLTGGFVEERRYVVQTTAHVVERCLLMTTDPGDLVLDPTCGSGTTAFVSERWGRRWITMDTSRVSIAVARQRLMTERYEHYRVRDTSINAGTGVDPGHGFINTSVPHVTLGGIARDANLDPIVAKHELLIARAIAACNSAVASAVAGAGLMERLTSKLVRKIAADGWQATGDADYRRWLLPGTTKAIIEQALATAFAGTKKKFAAKHVKSIVEQVPKRAEVGPSSIPEGKLGWEHWQVPFDTDPEWPKPLQDAVTAYRAAWRAKMDEVNACIIANAEHEELVDQPEVIKGVVRVTGPFTVEGVMPAELSLDSEGLFGGEPEELSAGEVTPAAATAEMQNIRGYLTEMVRLIREDGVNFLNNEHRRFGRVEPLFDAGSWNGIHAEAAWKGDGDADQASARATVAIGFGPQYGPVTAAQVEDLIREANRGGYDELIVAGFSFAPEATAILLDPGHPRLRIHAAQIRPDVNPGMNGLLKSSPGRSQLFTVFGLPSIEVKQVEEDEWQVTLEGVDIYDPVNNQIRSTGASKVAAWFMDGDYDGRTFCTTQAFFPDQDAWEKLARALGDVVEPAAFDAFKGTVSLPFPAGSHKRIAVKVIDPRGNEVMTTHDLK